MFGAQKAPVDVPCRVCTVISTVEIDPEDLARWHQGETMQSAFVDASGNPYLTAAERELLLSGLCDPCLQKVWRRR